MKLGLAAGEALQLAGSAEDALEASLMVLPVLTWYLSNCLWRVAEPARKREAPTPAETKKAQ